MRQATVQQILAPLRRKIQPRGRLIQVVRRQQRAGRRVVFTNGCFDVLHLGHITLLAQAKRLGDVLVVAINSDRSIRALKGKGRPLMSQRDRALLLASLESVDYVTVFNEPTPHNLVARLRPNVLVKGADWRAGAIVGRELVERDGGRVVRAALLKGYSTSGFIARIRTR